MEPKKERKVDKKNGDSFGIQLEDVIEKVVDIEGLAEQVTATRERPAIAHMNAEVRRRKGALIEDDIAELKKLASKGKVPKAEVQSRLAQV